MEKQAYEHKKRFGNPFSAFHTSKNLTETGRLRL